jgi:hypothetical protein
MYFSNGIRGPLVALHREVSHFGVQHTIVTSFVTVLVFGGVFVGALVGLWIFSVAGGRSKLMGAIVVAVLVAAILVFTLTDSGTPFRHVHFLG